MAKIAQVTIHLDEDSPDYMAGVIRCASVRSEDADGNVLHEHDDLIDNAEFESEQLLIEHIAKELGVSRDIVTVIR
jgi:hypothetical protein